MLQVSSSISIHELAKDKLFVFQPDKKKTLAYVFDDCMQEAILLTAQICAHLSDYELSLIKINDIFDV
jgi:hypothetical protein